MRLLNTQTLETVEFMDDRKLPKYAILSHTWGDDECSLQDMNDLRQNIKPEIEERKGYRKIQECCRQALQDGFKWAWVDSCCINKTSTAELSEAINSMFRWYQNASLCYVFLSDVRHESDLPTSRWFLRGWTLQELIAPKRMHFFSADWEFLGSKPDLRVQLQGITGIEESVLLTGQFDHVPVAKRMTWAAGRQTTRVEDRAYSLLGIFDVNMPLLYGEGEKSFRRLQEEIMKISDDQTLYAWGMPTHFDRGESWHIVWQSWRNVRPDDTKLRGLLADSPDDFLPRYDIIPLQHLQPSMPPIVANNGVRIELPVLEGIYCLVIVLSCTLQSHKKCYLGVPFVRWGEGFAARCGSLVLIPAVEDWSSSKANIKKTAEILVIKQAPSSIKHLMPNCFTFVRLAEVDLIPYTLEEVFCLPHSTYSAMDRKLTFAIDHEGPHGALIFAPDSPSPSTGFRISGSKPEFVFPFAVVVGSGPDAAAWASFVPLLPADHTDHVIRKMGDQYPEYLKNCMTRKQLKSLIQQPECETGNVFIKSTHIDRAIQRFQTPENKWDGNRWDVMLCIRLEEAFANLVEKSFFVYIAIDMAMVKGNIERLTQILHQKQRDPTWQNTGKLRWFSTGASRA